MLLVNDGLPMRLVMVDLEMTGVVPSRDSILQVAMVKLVLDDSTGNLQYVPKEHFECFIHTDAKPKKGFHQKYLSDVYRKCNESKYTVEDCREQVKEFLGSWAGKVMPVGDCVITDLRFLFEHNVIENNDIVKDKQVEGTFHYEVWDINSVKQIANQKLGRKFDKKMLPGYDFENIHNALTDCYNQTLELNFLLNVLLN